VLGGVSGAGSVLGCTGIVFRFCFLIGVFVCVCVSAGKEMAQGGCFCFFAASLLFWILLEFT
jgi:hypothetical protein